MSFIIKHCVFDLKTKSTVERFYNGQDFVESKADAIAINCEQLANFLISKFNRTKDGWNCWEII